MPINTGDNKFGVAKWIVDPISGLGTHTTIAGALTSASSGDTIFVRPGTYTENVTLKAGVNLTAFACDAITESVKIVGKLTASFAGTCAINSICLQTNSDYFLVVSGSSATVVNLQNCLLSMSNNASIQYTSSSSSSEISLLSCSIKGGGNYAFITSTGSGSVRISNCYSFGSESNVASTFQAGTLTAMRSNFKFPFSFTSFGTSYLDHCQIDTSTAPSTAITCTTSGTLNVQNCYIKTGTAQSVAANNGTTVNLQECVINSSVVGGVAVSGTAGGICQAGPTAWEGTASVINPTNLTISDLPFGRYNTYQPTVTFGGNSVGITYSTRNGLFWVFGKLVCVNIFLVLSSKGSSTGMLRVSLPLTTAADLDGVTNRCFGCYVGGGITYPSGADVIRIAFNRSASSVAFLGLGSGVSSALTNSSVTNSFLFQSCFFYWID